MAIRFYDEALVNKITKWDKNSNLHILKPDETKRLFEIKADEAWDKPIELPLIALSRSTNMKISNTNKRPMTFSGMRVVNFDKDGKEVKEKSAFQLNAIPVELEYQLDIYTHKFIEADEYVRNFVFNFINLPNLEVNIPYNNTNLRHKSSIHLSETVEDNSDIPQRIFSGQFTRMTLTLYIDDAYMFSVPDKEYWEVSDVDLKVENKQNEIISEEPIIISDK